MYIFKNAWKSISRSPSRNILIGIIVVVIAVSSCVALSIRNAAEDIIANTKDSFDITATLGLDTNSLMRSAQSAMGEDGNRTARPQDIMNDIPALDEATIKQYAASSAVKSVAYTMRSEVNSSNIVPVTNETQAEFEISQQEMPQLPEGQGPGGGRVLFSRQRGDFSVIGYSSTAAMTDFVSGKYRIKTDEETGKPMGSMFTDDETGKVCVISNELAVENDLAVGSVITITNPNDETQAYDYTVVGIYEEDPAQATGEEQNWFSNSANQILTTYSSLSEIVTASSGIMVMAGGEDDTEFRGTFSSTFTLKDADSVAQFESDLKAMGMSEYYTVSSNVGGYDETVKPLANLSNFAGVFLLLVLAIGGIVLIVLNMINIRERKYEVGVLRAIGMKKGNVALQFITELFVVTFIALSIGTAAGAAASVPTASYMLENEITAIEDKQAEQDENMGFTAQDPGGGRMINMFGGDTASQDVDYIDQISAVISLKVILQIALIGILLTVLSSSIAIIVISRYEPLKILSSRA